MLGINFLKGEIHNVTSHLRTEVRSGFFASNDAQEQKRQRLLGSLHELYSTLGFYSDLGEIDTCTYLDPFLDVLTSGLDSTDLLLCTLRSIGKCLLYNHINLYSPRVHNAFHSITNCLLVLLRNPSLDEVVLIKLMEVLCETIRSEAGYVLSDDDICAIVEQCFNIRERPGSTVLLRKYAENSLILMMSLIFSKLLPQKNQNLKRKLLLPENSDSSTISRKTSNLALLDKESEPEVKRLGSFPATIDDLNVEMSYKPYGTSAFVRILRVLATIISDFEKNTPETRQFGLQLLNTALETAGEHICSDEQIVAIIQDDICKAILLNSQTINFNILALTLRVVFDLFNTCKKHLKVQLEVFFTSIHLKIVQSPDSTRQQKELAMESLQELTLEPDLIVGLYTNYDCELGCTALFETLFKFLVAQAEPKSYDDVSEINLIASEGILTMVESIAKRFCSNAYDDDNDSLSETNELEQREIDRKRAYKKKLRLAVDEFNEKGAKALRYVGEVLDKPMQSGKQIAKFLRETSGIDKMKIGEFLSKDKPLSNDVLQAYINSFDFHDLTVDEGLRIFLESFMMGGEGQQISRIMEMFSARLFSHSPGPMADEDSCFTLCFAIIMLQSNLHKEQVRLADKMDFMAFKRQLRGINGGKDFPVEYLQMIYGNIKRNKFKLANDDPNDILCYETRSVKNSQWRKILSKQSQVGAFTTVASKQVGKDMFQIIWKGSLDILKTHLCYSQYPKVVTRITEGFESFARVCAVYQFYEPFNALMDTFSHILTTCFSSYPDDSKVSYKIRFGADLRAQIVMKFYYEMITTYGGNLVLNSWKSALHMNLQLFDMGLIFNTLQMDDFVGPKLTALPSMLAGKSPEVEPAQSFLTSFFPVFQDEEEESEDEQFDDPKYVETCEKEADQILKAFPITKILTSSTREFQDLNLNEVVTSCIHTIRDIWLKKNYSIKLKNPEEAVGYLLELLFVIINQNKDRLVQRWEHVDDLVAQILTQATVPSYVLERCVLVLFRLANCFSDQFEADTLTLLLDPLFKINRDIFSHPCINSRIISGFHLLLRSNIFDSLVSEPQWQPIFKLLMHYLRSSRLTRTSSGEIPALTNVIQALEQIIDRKTAQSNFNLIIESLELFLQPKSPLSKMKPNRVLEVYIRLSNNLLKQQTLDPTEIQTCWDSREVIVTSWFIIVESLLKTTTEHDVPQVRRSGLECLHKVCLGASDSMGADIWIQNFDENLLPLLQIVSQNDHLADLRIRVSALLFYSVLHKLNELAQSQEFPEFWTRFLDGIMTFMVEHAADPNIWVHCQENVKNIFLFGQMSGALEEAGSLAQINIWEITWEVLGKYNQTLRNHMKSLIQEMTESEQIEVQSEPNLVQNNPTNAVPHFHSAPAESSFKTMHKKFEPPTVTHEPPTATTKYDEPTTASKYESPSETLKHEEQQLTSYDSSIPKKEVPPMCPNPIETGSSQDRSLSRSPNSQPSNYVPVKSPPRNISDHISSTPSPGYINRPDHGERETQI